MVLDKIYNTPIQELIRQRYSCRTYRRQPINPEDLSKLSTFLDEHVSSPRGSSLRFKIITASKNDTISLKKLGTYGFIKDPAGFVIGTIKNQPRGLEDFGYKMELIILRAVELGIGSCWLGGTFTKSNFAKAIGLTEEETIPCVISIGYPADQQAWLDRVSRIYAGADRRLSWSDLFFSDSFEKPLSKSHDDNYSEVLEMLRLAPSASNKQPWRILRQDNLWHFYLQRTQRYPPPLFSFLLDIADLQRVDMGIAMAHFEQSALDLGLTGEWEINDPGYTDGNPGLEYNITWQSKT